MGNFEIMAQMSREDKEILLAPLSNITSARSGKDGYGRIEIAVPNEVVQKMLLSNGYYVGGLILANAEQYEEIRKVGATI